MAEHRPTGTVFCVSSLEKELQREKLLKWIDIYTRHYEDGVRRLIRENGK